MKITMHTKLLGVMASVLVSLSAGAATKYGLVVGINDFLYQNDLDGCVTDANNVYSLLTNYGGGWTSSNITKLTDSKATKSAILNAISSYANKAVSGDTFIYTQSSHGGEGVLCCYDDNISATELGTALRNFKSGVTVLCVIDACHSGSLPNKDANSKAVSGKLDFDSFIDEVNRTIESAPATRDGVARIANTEIGWCVAASASETSADMFEYYGGLFSYPFVQGAKSGSVDATYFSSPNGDDLSVGNADGYCTADEAFYYAKTAALAYDNSSYRQTAGIYNESVCKKVVLSTSNLVSLNTAADIALKFRSYMYDPDSSLYVKGAGWFGQTKTSYYGNSALQCTPPVQYGTACLDTTVIGPGTISFMWKSSTSDYGYLSLYVDGTEVDWISGATGWTSCSYDITDSGTHTISWEYVNTSFGYYHDDDIDVWVQISGFALRDDCAWIDKINWTGDVPMELGDTLNCDYLDFELTTSGDVNLSYDSNNEALRMAVSGDGSYAVVSTSVQGPCIVDFAWAGYAASGTVQGGLMINGNVADVSSTDGSWSYPSWSLPSESTYYLDWIAMSSGSSANGSVELADVVVWPGVLFDANGGSGSDVDLSSLSANSSNCYYDSDDGINYAKAKTKVTLPGEDVFSRDGYDFAGWEIDGVTYSAGSTFTIGSKPVTVKALWTEREDSLFELYYATRTPVMAKGAWSGYILDDYNYVIGSVEVKSGAFKNSKSSVTFSITLRNKKTVKVKGTMSLNLNGGWDCVAVGNGFLVQANFLHQNVYGLVNGFYFDCARDFMSDKDSSSNQFKNKIKAAKNNYVLSELSHPLEGKANLANGFIGLSVVVDAKGKTKLSGALPDGNKASGKLMLLADSRGAFLPLWTQINSKKGFFGGQIFWMDYFVPLNTDYGDWFTQQFYSLIEYDDSSKLSASKPVKNGLYSFYMPSYYGSYPASIDGSAVDQTSLPSYLMTTLVMFSGNKWVVASNDTGKIKLTYVPKTGLVKGSFTIRTLKKKHKVTVNGAYINGWGNCNGFIKGKTSMPLMIGFY